MAHLESPPAGSEGHAVVLGLGDRAKDDIFTQMTEQDHIPVVRRYTGGGTVFVDRNIRCASLLIGESTLTGIQRFPNPILDWGELFYRPVFSDLYGQTSETEFRMNGHDYCLGEKKIGGNAMTLARGRFTLVQEPFVRV